MYVSPDPAMACRMYCLPGQHCASQAMHLHLHHPRRMDINAIHVQLRTLYVEGLAVIAVCKVLTVWLILTNPRAVYETLTARGWR